MATVLLVGAFNVSAEDGLVYRLNPEGYICDWMLCGPFPNQEGSGVDQDFLAAAGGEKSMAPDFSKTYEVSIAQCPDKKINVKWFPHVLPDMERLFVYQVDLGNIVMDRFNLGSSDYLVHYGFVYIDSSVDQDVLLIISSDDEFKAWFNGEKIGEARGEQDMVADQTSARVTLKKGRNSLLVKSGSLISQVYALGESGYQFMARITDLNHQPLAESVSVVLPKTDSK